MLSLPCETTHNGHPLMMEVDSPRVNLHNYKRLTQCYEATYSRERYHISVYHYENLVVEGSGPSLM